MTKNLQTTKYRIFTLYLIQKFARLCHRALTSEQSTSTLLISSSLFPVCFPLLSKVICHFSKVCFTPFRFYERPILAPAFSNQKKPKEDFRFYQGKKKKHRQYSVCLAAPYRSGRNPEQCEWHHQAPSLETSLSISASSHHSPNCVYKHLCFIWICSVYLLARCVIR